jgi:hypothetical protein
MHCRWIVAGSLVVALWSADLGNASADLPEEKGMALGLFSQDAEFDYRDLLAEIRGLGATDVSLVWVWWQDTIRSTKIQLVPGQSATVEQVRRSMRDARELGLRVTLFPIVLIVHREPGEWRGQIKPDNARRWWGSYSDLQHECLRVATHGGAHRLVVGSELLSMENDVGRWRGLIRRLRSKAPGLELMYSANWDHFESVGFWDELDVVGLTAYWELTKNSDASVAELAEAWRPIREQVTAFAKKVDRPVVFTEVGYPSLDGGAVWPWDETRKAPVDLGEQARAYEAFVHAWSPATTLRGVYFWNWFGFGGPECRDYTPRGKPAEQIVRRWFASGGEIPPASVPRF